MFSDLIAAYVPYQASKADPANYPDHVQGLGMAFAQEWDRVREALEERFGEPADYLKYPKWMPTLIT